MSRFRRTCLVLMMIAFAPPAGGRVDAQAAHERADASSRAVVLGERRSLRSRTLGEKREVIVITPESYAHGTGRYPVLYLLDGAENMLVAATAARELAASARVPEMIVVCVLNTDRSRDFTPALTRTDALPREVKRGGGADAFVRFLGDELAPFIEAHYRTRPLRTVVGHSLGGLLAMHALATRPALFQRYITVDPSLWWDAGAEPDLVRSTIARQPALRARIAAVKGDTLDVAKMFGAGPPGVRATIVPLEGEAHEFLMYRGLYAGLIALFDDYYPAMRHDAASATLAALETQYAGLSRDFGYQVPIPMGALLEVANREANQRRFARARAALDRAAALYPSSRTPAEWRAQIAEFEADAEKRGQGEVHTRIVPVLQPASVIAPLLGAWAMRVTSPDPGFRPMTATARFAVRGDSLLVQVTVEGVAFDGGPYREPWTVVEVRGDTLRWDRENTGGGREITTVARASDGSFAGRADIVDGHELPPGFTPPPILVEIRRAGTR